MKIMFDPLDLDDLEGKTFVKLKNKTQRLTGRQSVNQLFSRSERDVDPETKFEHADLRVLARMGLLDELISGIKTGKEASVFLGRNSTGWVAVKVYTDLRVRSFRRDESYRAGRFIGDARLQKAIEQGSEKGLSAHQILWVQEEFKQMKYLAASGVTVPQAIAVNGIALLMEFIGDENGNPAPRLSDLKLEMPEAAEAFRQSVENLKLVVKAGRVHGDYSAFNLLWHNEKVVVIDFPQVLECGQHPNAEAFLRRDVRSLCSSFLKQGVKADEVRIYREVRRFLPD
jgi:RIO kinase 1